VREAKVDCVGICEILQANLVECCGGYENVSHSRDPSVACAAASTGERPELQWLFKMLDSCTEPMYKRREKSGKINGRVYG
jgi:hypothetical protein